MNIRKILRLSCLTVASLFWASCGEDTNSQAPSPEIPDPDSSSDASVSSSSETPASSAVEEGSSSSVEPGSSETVGSSSSGAPDVSSSSIAGYVLARDASVTCKDSTYSVPACTSTKALTCDDYKRYLASDTSISQKILTSWEKKLQDCGAIGQVDMPLYGVVYDPCGSAFYYKSAMKCSNDSTYKDYKLDGNKVYTSVEEYNEAFGISSSSVAPSSSSVAEDLVQNCPHEGFVLFTELFVEVQKDLYELFADEELYMAVLGEASLTDAGKEYIKSILDPDNKTLKARLAPFSYAEDVDDYYFEHMLKSYSDNWFDGYIAKTQTCADGVAKNTKLYDEVSNNLINECVDLIMQEARSKT